jgi:hypothetical protein
LKLHLRCRDTEGIHALVTGEINYFKRHLKCRDKEGLHALITVELNDFK